MNAFNTFFLGGYALNQALPHIYLITEYILLQVNEKSFNLEEGLDGV